MSIGPGGHGTRAILHRYPCVDGLTAETTTQEGHKETLEPVKTLVEETEKKGL